MLCKSCEIIGIAMTLKYNEGLIFTNMYEENMINLVKIDLRPKLPIKLNDCLLNLNPLFTILVGRIV